MGSALLVAIMSMWMSRGGTIATSMRLSCKSDKFDGTKDMVGMALWSYKGKDDWNINGIHCKSGYVYLRTTESIEHISSNAGIVHGKLYKSLFHCDPEGIIATGFAFQNGEWKFSSATFNVGTEYHDGDRKASSEERSMILKLVGCDPGTTMSATGARLTMDTSGE